ncbi:MAG: hypothetical protein WEB04_06760 [Dehalococcoidia bacterium]
MSGQKQQQGGGVNVLEVAARLVAAVTATIAAVRAGQGALRAWQRVVAAVRGGDAKAGKGGT